jgi:choline-sulfatase
MFWKSLFISLCGLIFAFFALTALRQAEEKRSPRIVLLTVESLRADQVNEDTMPHLLRAARLAHHFDKHRAVSGWTATNIVTLLTGLSPFASGVHTRGQTLPAKVRPPLYQLRERGYLVEGLQPFMAMDIYENLGFTVNTDGPEPTLWLAEQKQEGRPFFLWYHYVNTHLPYGPEPLPADWPEDAKIRLEKVRSQDSILAEETLFTADDVQRIHALQRNRIIEFDRWFADFWAFWQGAGLSRDTILIVTADHGDEHGERGMTGHASTTLAGHLHEEIVRVPLFIWLPDRFAGLKKSFSTETPSSHLDIIPTILARLAITPEKSLEGRDLFRNGPAAGSDRPEKANPWLGMTSSGGFAEPDPQKMRYFEYASLENQWKYRLRMTMDGKEEFSLYNLDRDPGEKIDLAALHPDIAARQHQLLKTAIAERVVLPVRSQTGKSDEGGESLGWLRPERSGTYSYEDFAGKFHLQWTGENHREYLLEYRAGRGRKELSGTITVRGTSKDFGSIDRRYWQTWIVPNSPFHLRVREVDGQQHSPWLLLEARP